MLCVNGRVILWCFFFFQAEDGIRDIGVTGVQTCALPICVAHIYDPLPTSAVSLCCGPHC